MIAVANAPAAPTAAASGTKFKVEVIADSSGKWCSNRVQYDTFEKANEAGADLMSRWMAVREYRVVPVPVEELEAVAS